MNKLILLSIVFCGVSVIQGSFKTDTSNTNQDETDTSKTNQEETDATEQDTEKTPDKIVQSLFDDYFIPIKEKNPAESEPLFVSAIKEIIGKYFDIGKIVNTVLGPQNKEFTESEKNEFTELLVNKMSFTYGKQFSEFEDIQNFEITGVENKERKKDGKKCCIVTSYVLMKGEKIELKWFFLEDNNHEMKIIDIKVAGISLTQNWQAQAKAVFAEHKEIREFLDNFNKQ